MVLNARMESRGTIPAFDTAGVLARIRASVTLSEELGGWLLTFKALGTSCRIGFAAGKPLAHAWSGKVLEWVASFEAKYSRFQEGSLISKINAAAGLEEVVIDTDTEQLFALCDKMHFITGGVFDPSALPLVGLWDWKRPLADVPSDAAIAVALERVGWSKVRRKPGSIFLPQRGMGIDLGGMGKEFAVDRVAQHCAPEGIESAVIDFGSDVRTVGLPWDGRPGWHVGLDDPRAPGRCWCGLGIQANAAVATSGDYFRKFEKDGRRYGHILDVRTGRPVDNGCLAVSVVAPSCTLAGMLSTACFILGTETGLRLIESQPGTAAAVVGAHGTVTSRSFYNYVVS